MWYDFVILGWIGFRLFAQKEIFFRRITHMCRRWGKPQNFCLAFTDELEKQLLIKKLMKGAKKNVRILISMLYFFKIEKHTWRHDFTHVYLNSWWYDQQFLRIRVWQAKIGNYVWVFALLTPTSCPAKSPKNQNFEKMKKLLEISFYTCAPKTTIIWGTFSEIEWDTQIFLSFWAILALLTPP